MRLRSVTFLGLLASVFIFASPASSDSAPGCGSTLTGNVVLEADIGPCAGTGLIVAAGGVTIDLRGHTVSGLGAGAGISIGTGGAPQGGVRVKNGTLEGFGSGVTVADGEACAPQPGVITVENVEIRFNGTGISVFTSQCDAEVVLIRNKVARNTGDGIFVGGADPTRIVDNEVVGNGGVGINAFFDSVRTVADNFVSANGSDGIRLNDTVSSVTNNVMLRNGGLGLSIRESASSLIAHYVVSENVADGNALGGMSAAAFPDPPGPPAGSGNAAKHNGGQQCVLIVCAKNRGLALHASRRP